MDEKKNFTALLLAAVMVASVFAMTVPVSAAPVPATVTNVSKSSFTEASAGSNVSEGGYVTNTNFSVAGSTSKWQGYYGNVSGGLVLGSGEIEMFKWTWDTSLGGEVFATTNESVPPWGNLNTSNNTAAFTKEITYLWGWTPASASDNATMTLNSSSSVNIAGRAVMMNHTHTNALLGGTAQGWQSGAVATTTPDEKKDYIFVGIINNDNTSFDGTKKDYEMLVPVNETVGATETYIFYVEMS